MDVPAWVSAVTGAAGLFLGSIVRPLITSVRSRRRHSKDMDAVALTIGDFGQWQRRAADPGHTWVGVPVHIRNSSDDKIKTVAYGAWRRERKDDPAEAERRPVLMPGESADGTAWLSIPDAALTAGYRDNLISFVRFDDANGIRWEIVHDTKAKRPWKKQRIWTGKT